MIYYLKFMQQIGWLDRLTNWLKQAFKAIFDAFVLLMHDLIIAFMKAILDFVQLITDNILVPDFLTDYSICSLLAQAGPEIGWAWNSLRLSECMLILGAGYSFRMLRKLFTLFQW